MSELHQSPAHSKSDCKYYVAKRGRKSIFGSIRWQLGSRHVVKEHQSGKLTARNDREGVETSASFEAHLPSGSVSGRCFSTPKPSGLARTTMFIELMPLIEHRL